MSDFLILNSRHSHNKNRNVSSFGLSLVFFRLVIAVSLYYLAYRYPLMINSSTTSPTYSDTPFSLSLGKYVLISSLLVIGFFVSRKGSRLFLGFFYNNLIIFYLVCAFWLLFLGLISSNFYYFEFLFCFLFSVGLWQLLPRELSNSMPEIIDPLIRFFVLFSAIFQLYQYWNYIVYNRLPALGYENSISVRFGGVWDDPNGFALWLSFLIPYIYYRFSGGIFKTVLLVLFFLFLIFTQSLTGIFSFLFSLILFYAFCRRDALGGLFLSMIYLLVFFGISACLIVYFWDFFELFYRLKAGSIEGHAGAFDFSQFGALDVLGIGLSGMFGESSYVNFLYAGGGVFFFGIVAVNLVIFFRLVGNLYSLKVHDVRSLPFVFFWFSVSIAMINLPVETIFPINVIYFFVTLYLYSVLLDIRHQSE